MSSKVLCFRCQNDCGLSAEMTKISRRAECDSCAQDLHCCRMCTFYDESAYNQCREPNASRVVEKEKANFCDYFELASAEAQQNSQQNLRDKANALFKD